MGLRFRNSVKVCKGVRLNFNKNSLGLSVGGKGYGYTINSKGQKTAHVGIPGTGLSYSQSYGRNTGQGGVRKNPMSQTYTTIQTEYRLQMDDSGKMRFFYPNGNEIFDPTLINKIKRASGYQQEKARMQREHDAYVNEEIQMYNNQNSDLIYIFRQAPPQIYNWNYYNKQYEELKNELASIYYGEPMPSIEMIREELRREADLRITTVAFWKKKGLRDEYIATNENQSVYSGENVPSFRRNGNRCSG